MKYLNSILYIALLPLLVHGCQRSGAKWTGRHLSNRHERLEHSEIGCLKSHFWHVEFGFAAGCEAVAWPRRHKPRHSWAMPVVRA